jgi:hypothetical protein
MAVEKVKMETVGVSNLDFFPLFFFVRSKTYWWRSSKGQMRESLTGC